MVLIIIGVVVLVILAALAGGMGFFGDTDGFKRWRY